MGDKKYLSKEGLEKIKKDLAEMLEERKAVSEHIKYAKSLGDLSENAEYSDAKEEQAMLEEKIAHLEDVVRRGVVIKKQEGGVAGLGSTVVIKKIGGDSELSYEIVGAEEADISASKLSNESPLGSALIGAKKGEEVGFSTPGGEVKYKVLEVK